MTTHAYLWGPHWDPAIQKRVNQVGARCKKCGSEEWSPAQGPGWGRRIFKNRGWHLGATANNHTCPKCVAKKHAPKKPNGVLHAQAEHVDMPPIRPATLGTTALVTQGRNFDTPQEFPVASPTALAEALAPLKNKLELKARRVKARGQPNGFVQKSSAAAAARRFITDKLGVRKPLEDVHYRTVHDPDGTYSYVLIAMNLPKPPPEAAKAMPEPAPKRKKAYFGGGRPPFPPGKVRAHSSHGRMADSAQRYLFRAFGVADAKEGVDFMVVRQANGLSYELIGRGPVSKVPLAPAAPGVTYAPWRHRGKGVRETTPNTLAYRLRRVTKPDEARRTNPGNMRHSAVRYLILNGVENPLPGVHYETYTVGSDMVAYRLLVPVNVPADVRYDRHNQNPEYIRQRALTRTLKPGEISGTTGGNRKWNLVRAAKRYIELVSGISDAAEGVHFRVISGPGGTFSYELIEPQKSSLDPTSGVSCRVDETKPPPMETPQVSDASNQAVRAAVDASIPKPPVREMTFADKRRIREAVEEIYDEENGHYKGDWDDKTLAERLNVPRVWVSQVRDLYGPDKNDAERLRQEAVLMATRQKLTRLNSLVDEAKKIADSVLELAAKLNDKMSDVEALKKELGL